ncbi:hypothetical protein ACQBAU_01055 [Propionibacteriaceae bacterium Y2011]|uniref:hypothetical protein n=1 Tax=Microlunatus sp. Y2014 TaxID=3418488 RepID=UPI003B4B9B08
MCLLIIGLAVTAFFLARNGKLGPPPWVRGGPHHPHHPHHAPEREAFATLANRLAAGDITPDEYRERLAVLRESQQPGNPPPYNPGSMR